MDLVTLLRFILAAVLLALATGVYAFIPVLAVAVAARLGFVGLHDLQWLAHPGIILLLSVALFVEIVIEHTYGWSKVVETFVAIWLKPWMAAVVVVAILPPDVGPYAALFLGALPAAVAQVVNLSAKWTLRTEPFTNIGMAAAGLVVSAVIATWAVWIYPDAPQLIALAAR